MSASSLTPEVCPVCGMRADDPRAVPHLHSPQEVAVRRAAKRLEVLEAALRQWKCPACGGSRRYAGYSRAAPEGQPCKKCADTDGLHPTAYAALRDNGDTT